MTKHYNEVFDQERQDFAQKLEKSFYSGEEHTDKYTDPDIAKLLEKMKNNPELVKALAQSMA